MQVSYEILVTRINPLVNQGYSMTSPVRNSEEAIGLLSS